MLFLVIGLSLQLTPYVYSTHTVSLQMGYIKIERFTYAHICIKFREEFKYFKYSSEASHIGLHTPVMSVDANLFLES